MPLPQKKFREIVFQILYSLDTGHSDEEEIVNLLMKELSVTRKTVRQALERAKKVILIREETDKMISQTSFSYAFNRIQTVEKNVLRLGLYELFFDDQIPPKVAISEAMRLARKFGSPESANFVNAILDALYKVSKGEEVNVKQITETADQLMHIEEKSTEASLNQKPEEDEHDNE